MKYQKHPVICIIGLGYVGLPLAVMFGKTELTTYGFARTKSRVDELRGGIDRTNEVSKKELRSSSVLYTNNPEDIKKCDFIIVAVPTPVDESHVPDLSPVLSASELVGKHMKKNTVVVFESTVYPGVTEELCIPLLEKASGLHAGEDFVVGYSPERTNPGDKDHTPDMIVKVTSGMNPEAGEYIDKIYKKVIKAGTYLAKDIKTAEAAKVIENTQRDINIAVINELAMIFDRLGIDTREVLAAAGTKWNFLKFKPGLVGGHCIGVDPYYLVHKAETVGYHPQLITAARRINDDMPAFCATQIVKMLIKNKTQVEGAKVLVLGGTFKENVKDMRNSKVMELIKELKEYGLDVFVYEPLVPYEEIEYKYLLDEETYIDLSTFKEKVDAICYAVDHNEFKNITLSSLRKLSYGRSVLFDIPGRFYQDNDRELFVYKSL